MASLAFEFEEPEEERVHAHILCDFLQPDTQITLQTAVETILESLADDTPWSSSIRSFLAECIEIAELIPYDHPSMIKLVSLIKLVYDARVDEEQKSEDETRYRLCRPYDYHELAEVIRDFMSSPGKGRGEVTALDISRYTNFNAFAAQVAYHILQKSDSNPTWAIWELRDAHETYTKGSGNGHDAIAMAASQWIMICGDVLFDHIRNNPDEKDHVWWEGPRYKGLVPAGEKDKLTIRRWHFWREGFTAIASGDRDAENGTSFSQESKDLSAKAAKIMEELETEQTAKKEH